VGGEHRLVVLLLVLDDHAEGEAVLDQAAAGERRALQQVEDAAAHLAHVVARLARVQQRQRRTLEPRVLERVVELVHGLGQDRVAAADVAEQPQLLLVADVRQVPHQRRHQPGVLRDEVGVVDGVGEQCCPGAGAVEVGGDALAQGVGARGAAGGGEGGGCHQSGDVLGELEGDVRARGGRTRVGAHAAPRDGTESSRSSAGDRPRVVQRSR
jgi:hypothetical protein